MSETVVLDVTGVAHGGVFVARHEGRVVFVSDAIPGERVRALLSDTSKSTFWRAQTVEVLRRSAHRVEHIWPEASLAREPAERAGGADFGHIELSHQRELKRTVLQESLNRFAGGGLLAPAVRAVDDTAGTHWRTRVSLHVAPDGTVGPVATRSHHVVPVVSYPLATTAIESAITGLRGAKPGRIDLVEPSDGAVRLTHRPDRTRPPKPEVVYERAAGRTFAVDATGFWQVHSLAAGALDAELRSLLAGRVAPGGRHLDLYGGVGLFSWTLTDLGARGVFSVESSRRASLHAARNLAAAKTHVVTSSVDRYLSKEQGPIGAAVLDPPRAGAGRKVVNELNRLSPEVVAYVACDPVALSRDLGFFRERGWEVEQLRAFDLFPHSHHFEAIAILSK